MLTASCRRTTGFSRTELLGALGLVLILILILYPVLIGARDKSRQNTCLANTHQMGEAMLQYAQDYDQTLFPYETKVTNTFSDDPNVGSKAKELTFFHQILNPYLRDKKNLNLWACPSAPNAWINVDPSAPTNDQETHSDGGQNSYSVNLYCFPTRPKLPVGLGLPLKEITNTATTLVLTDGAYFLCLPRGAARLRGDTGEFNPADAPYASYWKNLGNSSRFVPSGEPLTADALRLIRARHNATLSALFADGHAKNMPVGDVVDDLTNNPSQSIWDPYKQGVR